MVITLYVLSVLKSIKYHIYFSDNLDFQKKFSVRQMNLKTSFSMMFPNHCTILEVEQKFDFIVFNRLSAQGLFAIFTLY